MRPSIAVRPIALAVAAILVCSAAATADWLENGNPVCAQEGDQDDPAVCAVAAQAPARSADARVPFDVFVAWTDDRNWGHWQADICAQVVDQNGDMRWFEEGMAVCTAPGRQSYPIAVPDGAGGAIVVWQDRRDSTDYNHLYAQRMDPSGAGQWAEDGVLVCPQEREPWSVQAIADGYGGIIVVWLGKPDGSDYTEVQAQRLDQNGAPQWGDYAAVFSDSNAIPAFPVVTPDGTGGAIVAFECDSGPEPGVHAQRVSGTGSAVWTSASTRICTGDGYDPAIASDGAGGAIVAWEDYRAQEPLFVPDIYAQRVNASGGRVWAEGGVAVCTAYERQDNPEITTDGSNGCIICWEDVRIGDDEDIYARRVDGDGNPLWVYDGEPICAANGDQEDARIVSDDGGGAVIAWEDWRGGAHIYAQHVGAGGAPTWEPNGAAVCISIQVGQPELSPDGSGGGFVVWSDGRNEVLTGDHDIYAKWLDAYYTSDVGVPETTGGRLALEQNAPNPFNPVTKIRCHVPDRGSARLDILDLSGRVVARLVDRVWSEGPHDVEWTGRDDSGRPVASGVYFCRISVGSEVATRKMVLIR